MITYLASGVVTRPMLPMLAVVLPTMLLPALLGTRAYLGISEAAFRRLVLSLLTGSGITLAATAIPKIL
jgi:uncharacterized membrane protein YfcA